MIYKAIQFLLLADSAVSAIVGTKVFAVLIPQEVDLPYIGYSIPVVEHTESMSGSSGLAEADVTVECFSETFVEVRALKEAVRLALQGLPAQVVDGVSVRRILLPSERTDFFVPEDASELGVHTVSMEFKVSYNETIPAF